MSSHPLVVAGTPPACLTVKPICGGRGYRVATCLHDGSVIVAGYFETHKAARIFALRRASRLGVEVRT